MLDVNTLSLSQIVAEYNKRAPTPVKKFRDRATAVRRLEPLLKAEAPRARPRGRRRVFHNYPARLAQPREPRAGTKRAVLVELLRRGATFAEISSRLGWGAKMAREQVVALNRQCGFAIQDDGDRVKIG